MKRVVKYIPVDPYYSEQIQTYIGSTLSEIDDIQYETEQFMAKEHCSLSMIYKQEILFDNTFDLFINNNKHKNKRYELKYRT